MFAVYVNEYKANFLLEMQYEFCDWYNATKNTYMRYMYEGKAAASLHNTEMGIVCIPLCLSHKWVATRRRWVQSRKFHQNLATHLTISPSSAAHSGRLRRIAEILGIGKPAAVPSWRSVARFWSIFGHPRRILRLTTAPSD